MFSLCSKATETLRRIQTQKQLFDLSKMFSTAPTNASAGFLVQHDQKNHKFFINLGAEEALLDYAEKPKGVLDLYHTEVPISHRGQRIGNVLAEAAFKYAVSQNLKMKLSCTFLQKYARENPNDEVNKHIV